MKQFTITPVMGKRLIGLGMAAHPAVQAVLKKGTLLIVAGSTNGYVAEEILKGLGIEGFDRKGFRRGTVFPPGFDARTVASPFPGDVVLVDGVWQKGKTIFDVADGLKAGDVILKGANTLDLLGGQGAALIGDPQTGTAGAAIRAVVGRRAQMIVPVGLEKRVLEDVRELAEELERPRRERAEAVAAARDGLHGAGCDRRADGGGCTIGGGGRHLRRGGQRLGEHSRHERAGGGRRQPDPVGGERAGLSSLIRLPAEVSYGTPGTAPRPDRPCPPHEAGERGRMRPLAGHTARFPNTSPGPCPI